MKRINELRTADLDRAPVWRYEGAGDDSAVVHATARTELTETETGVFIARTQFVLNNGTQHIGFCSPTDDSGLDYLQPVILTECGPVFFWFDTPPSEESLHAQWHRLGSDHQTIFPVHFRCTVPVDGRYVTGTINESDLTSAA